jgi:o-succinylbenzoate---CoA ligase
MPRALSVVHADGGPADAAAVSAVLARSLTGQATEALSVLPVGPDAWRATLRVAVRPDRPVPDEVAVALPTSGSTGGPAGVLLGAAPLRWTATSMTRRLGGAGSWVLALPVTHVAGLMVLVRALVTGSAVVPVDLRPGFRPEAFAAAADRLPPGRAYTSLVPTQLARLLDAGETAVAALRRFDAVLLGGAAASADLLARAAAAGVVVATSYGMTETCGGCVVDGRPLPEVGVALDDSGRIRLAGPMLATARRRGDRDVPIGPWWDTADAGRWDGDRLVVLGRLDDVVLCGGVSVPLGQVDALLAACPDLRDAVAVGVADPTWGTRIDAIGVPRDPHRPPTLEQVRAFVAARAEPAFVPHRLVLVDRLPRPAPGKIDRPAARRLAETA